MTRTSNQANRTSVARGRFRKIAAVAIVAGALGACSRLDDLTAVELSEPPKRHPVAYTPHSEALLVEVPPGVGGLSASQEADVWRFVDRYKKEGTGRLLIASPRSAGGHLATSRSMRHVERIVREAGIDPDAVNAGRYTGNSRVGPAVRLAYERPVAVPPQCRDWSTDLGENRERIPYNDFGCATQRNLALTVANARDLQVAQEETPRSSERRSTTWDGYKGTGAATGAAPPTAGSGATPAGGAAP